MDHLDNLLANQLYPHKSRVKQDITQLLSQIRSLRPQIGQLGFHWSVIVVLIDYLNISRNRQWKYENSLFGQSVFYYVVVYM